MKNCFEREQLFAYALEMLEAQDKLEVRQHVAKCARCRGVLALSPRSTATTRYLGRPAGEIV